MNQENPKVCLVGNEQFNFPNFIFAETDGQNGRMKPLFLPRVSYRRRCTIHKYKYVRVSLVAGGVMGLCWSPAGDVSKRKRICRPPVHTAALLRRIPPYLHDRKDG